MFVLITYDVNTMSQTGQKRLRQVAKACTNYGLRVQNSVFECVVTESQFLILQSVLESIIDFELDSICFYFLGKNYQRRVKRMGKKTTYDVSEELII